MKVKIDDSGKTYQLKLSSQMLADKVIQNLHSRKDLEVKASCGTTLLVKDIQVV